MRNRKNSKMEMTISKYPIHTRSGIFLYTHINVTFSFKVFCLVLPKEFLPPFLIFLNYSVFILPPNMATSNFHLTNDFIFLLFFSDYFLFEVQIYFKSSILQKIMFPMYCREIFIHCQNQAIHPLIC